MNNNSITKIWTIIGISLAYISFNAYVRTLTKKDFGIPLNLFKLFGNYSTSVFAILVCSLLLCSVIFLSLKYFEYKRDKDISFLETLPVAFSIKIDDFNKIESKIYQSFFFIIFLLFPLAGIIRFLHKFWSYKEKIVCDFGVVEIMTFCGFKPFYKSCKYDGDAFYPFWEPILLTLLSIFTFAYFIYYVVKVNRLRLRK